ncbi:MAG: hypothetical protein CMK06_08385 [Ponticaulis sp.]|nr:hypothetical protein [Ponticaulis sp.]|tara:strand:- start:167 stop:388 length:222 start_codon:yes stop_codon:yes gene_type:complete
MDGSDFGFDERIRDLKKQLDILEKDHRAIDLEVSRLQSAKGDMIALQRLKRSKLRMRDEISRLRGLIYPNIIA